MIIKGKILYAFYLSDKHNYAYIIYYLCGILKFFGILLTLLTYGDGLHKYICTCYLIKYNIVINFFGNTLYSDCLKAMHTKYHGKIYNDNL